MMAFDVYLDGECINTIFYISNSSADCQEVRDSLVNHDGYSDSIEVYEYWNESNSN